MNKEFVRILREKFAKGLEAKTGWGRKEIQALFDTCVAEAALECLELLAKGGEAS